MKRTIQKNKERGFTLLFASLVVTLILSIAIAIANVTLTQLILSSAGKDSQFAFYNADSGIECALYYENNGVRPDTSPYFASDASKRNPPAFTCGGIPAVFPADPVGSGLAPFTSATTTFSINISPCDTSKPSYEVKVGRSLSSTIPGLTNVFIESRGYNTCDPTNPRRIERGLYVKFAD